VRQSGDDSAVRGVFIAPSHPNVHVTAYENESRVVVVAVNTSSSPQTITLDMWKGRVGAFTKYTTSGSKNVANDGVVSLGSDSASVTLDARSVTTFVGRGPSPPRPPNELVEVRVRAVSR
jgi:O-glycosyl hydrolase